MNYDAGGALAECVASLRREGAAEIVVVDNDSTDDSLSRLAASDPDVDVVSPGRNLGYGGGANFGARRVGGELLLVCNPDVALGPGALDALESRLAADPSLGLVGPALVAPDGTACRSGGAFPTIGRSSLQALLGALAPESAYSRRYRAENRALGESGVLDWVTGACFLVRRQAFDAVGGFDERYFMYVEEVDLCWRLAKAGWRTGYEASAVVVHLSGVSTSSRPYRMALAHHRSLWRFARRTATGPARLLLPAVAVGTVVRWAVVSLRRIARRPG